MPHADDYAPTDAQREAALQAAFESLVSNGVMTAPTLTDAMSNPLSARLIRMHAVARLRGVSNYGPARLRPVVQAPEPPHPVHAVGQPAHQAPPQRHSPPAPKRRPGPIPIGRTPRPSDRMQPPTPPQPGRPAYHRASAPAHAGQHHLFDPKRAAAGDRDEPADDY